MADLNKIETVALEFIKLEYEDNILAKIARNPEMYNLAIDKAYEYAKIFIDRINKQHESLKSSKNSRLRVLNENYD